MVRTIREMELPERECYNCKFFSAAYTLGWCDKKIEKGRKQRFDSYCNNWKCKEEGEPHRYGDRIILYDWIEGGSTTDYYYSGWSFISNLVYIRDNNTCQRCGKKGEESNHKRGIMTKEYKLDGFEVHHIIPKAKGGNGHLKNLILLCLKCHNRTKNSSYLHRYKWVGIDTAQQRIMEVLE